MRLAHRFADKHDVSTVGLPSKAGIRRELEGLNVEQLQELQDNLQDSLKEIRDGER